MSTAAAPAPLRVGIVCGSTRVVRCGPQVTAFVQNIIEADLAKQPVPDRTVELELIDLGAQNLPLSDEPGIPSVMSAVPDGYVHEHTRAWSRRIAALDGFVFVTSQHNGSVPAGLKNAIDYLFQEWKGKPFMVVSYGGHGGGRAAEALQQILGRFINMRALDETVNLTFPGREFVMKASQGADLGLAPAGTDGVWQDRTDDIVKLWRQLTVLLTTPPAEKKE